MESTYKYIPGSAKQFQYIEDRDEDDKWSFQVATALQEMKNNEIDYMIYSRVKYSAKYVIMLFILEISDYSNNQIIKIYEEKYLLSKGEL